MHECMNIPWSEADGAKLTTDDFLTIKVSGVKYETMKKTMERFPNTLLGNETSRQVYYVPSKNAYFLDRCITCFEAVLYYYQSGGILIRPPSIPMHVFEEEIEFYGLGEDALKNLHREEGFFVDASNNDDHHPNENETLQNKIWRLIEYPDSSSVARILSCFTMFVISVSIIIFVMETLPVFKDEGALCAQSRNWFMYIEMGCVIWFTLEYFIRFLSSPSKYHFLTSFLNLIDLLTILPYFIMLAIKSDGKSATPLSVLRVVRLVRVFRIFKLSRHSMSLQILGNTLRASMRELGMLMFFLFLSALIFSTLLFHIEGDRLSRNSTFRSILDSFWYSLVTMTTVGYGDFAPSSICGKFIGSICAVTGVLTLAMPVPVIVANFHAMYRKDRPLNKKDDKVVK